MNRSAIDCSLKSISLSTRSRCRFWKLVEFQLLLGFFSLFFHSFADFVFTLFLVVWTLLLASISSFYLEFISRIPFNGRCHRRRLEFLYSIRFVFFHLCLFRAIRISPANKCCECIDSIHDRCDGRRQILWGFILNQCKHHHLNRIIRWMKEKTVCDFRLNDGSGGGGGDQPKWFICLKLLSFFWLNRMFDVFTINWVGHSGDGCLFFL